MDKLEVMKSKLKEMGEECKATKSCSVCNIKDICDRMPEEPYEMLRILKNMEESLKFRRES